QGVTWPEDAHMGGGEPLREGRTVGGGNDITGRRKADAAGATRPAGWQLCRPRFSEDVEEVGAPAEAHTPEGEGCGDREAEDRDDEPAEGADEAQHDAPRRHRATLWLARTGEEAEHDREDAGDRPARRDGGDTEHEARDAESVGGGCGGARLGARCGVRVLGRGGGGGLL